MNISLTSQRGALAGCCWCCVEPKRKVGNQYTVKWRDDESNELKVVIKESDNLLWDNLCWSTTGFSVSSRSGSSNSYTITMPDLRSSSCVSGEVEEGSA